MKFKIMIFIMIFSLILASASAHPGRIDSNGGHYCWTNCEKWGLEYGEYHYHNGGITPTITVTPNPTPTPTPAKELDYKIQPVIYLAADTSIDTNSYQAQVDASFAAVRYWYAEQLGGKTFNLQPALVYRSPLTESQLYAQYGTGTGIWYKGLKEATAAYGLNVCDERRFYYFITPVDDASGGMVGAENLGCSYVLPGTAATSGHMGRLVGGIIDPDWQEWWADEIREAQGGVAHEIGHGLGGSCVGANDINGQCNGLPHPADWDTDSIILKWWLFGTTGKFTDTEKAQILRSLFISAADTSTPTPTPTFTAQVGKWIKKADTPSAGGYGEAVAGTNNNIYVIRNLYASSNPEFWRYDPSTDSWSSIGTSGLPLGAFRTGTALAWDNGSYIYALPGARYSDTNRRLFYRYSITNNNWEQLADTPHAQGAGDAITWSGYDGYIYAIIGSAQHGTAFARYKYNSWEVLNLNPNWTVTDDGASLAWTGGEYLYALRGEYAETVPNGDFAGYHIPSQTWVDMKDIPESEGVGDGASLLHVRNYPDYIFALGGGDVYENPGYNFYSYSISTDSWEQLESIPCPIGYYVGNRLGFANGSIYYWQGSPTTDKWICGGDAFYMFEFKPAPPTNITVCPVGCNYTSIQAAINASNPGDTILVYGGTYYENVNVNKQVILRGIDTGGGKPVVDAGGNGSAINITADGTTLEGFNATNSKTWPYAGIEVVSNSNTIRGNIISNSNFGIYLTSSGNNTLRNNLMSRNLYNFGAWGWMDSHFDNDIDTSNLVDGKPIYYLVGASGTVIDSSSGAGTVYCIKCDNVTVKDLLLINNSNGISFYQTRDSKIQNNHLSNNGAGISFYISSNNTITGNNVSSNWGGFSIQSSSSNTITNNTVSNNHGNCGIYLGYSNSNTLSGNTASNNYNGIYLSSSSNNTLIGNNVSNNDIGIFLV